MEVYLLLYGVIHTNCKSLNRVLGGCVMGDDGGRSSEGERTKDKSSSRTIASQYHSIKVLYSTEQPSRVLVCLMQRRDNAFSKRIMHGNIWGLLFPGPLFSELVIVIVSVFVSLRRWNL